MSFKVYDRKSCQKFAYLQFREIKLYKKLQSFSRHFFAQINFTANPKNSSFFINKKSGGHLVSHLCPTCVKMTGRDRRQMLPRRVLRNNSTRRMPTGSSILQVWERIALRGNFEALEERDFSCF
jgi:hypothetical protein